MAKKITLVFGQEEYLSATTPEKIGQAIQREMELWSDHYDSLQYVDSNRNRQSTAYGRIINKVQESGLHNGEIDLKIDGLFKVFPKYDSDKGRYLRSLKERSEDLSRAYLNGLILARSSNGRPQHLIDAGTHATIGQLIEWVRSDTLKQISGASAKAAILSSSERIESLKKEHDDAAQNYEDNIAGAQSKIRADLDEIATYQTKLKRVVGKLVARAARRQAKQEKSWRDRWQELHDSYILKLRYESAVTLWSGKGKQHRTSSRWAFGAFCAIACVTGLFAIGITTQFGDFIAESFTKVRALPGEKPVEVFSYKGPVLVAGLLLASSILIWLMRFMGRIYLSERHLALAAEERKAFAETFHALVTDKTITAEHEAIVLAALFRPGQDGIIKDDEGGALDISAATILAKAMAGPR